MNHDIFLLLSGLEIVVWWKEDSTEHQEARWPYASLNFGFLKGALWKLPGPAVSASA